ncbi:MAG: hypothetical protein GY760_02590 [Deltaproteobacteria bacterium]|nr:hypothetical protein [Deltaproteobacteria bacterium]
MNYSLNRIAISLVLFTSLTLATNTLYASGYDKYFVTSSWLKKNIDKKGLVIIDAREGDAYSDGHINGSRSLKWKQVSDMTKPFAHRGWGTVTDKNLLEGVISKTGITKKSEIIIYADTKNGWGEDGRIYWTFRIAGLTNIRILDGGIDGWENSKGDINEDVVNVQRSDFKLKKLSLNNSIDTNDLIKDYKNYKILDTRTLNEYKGARKYGEKRGGHLPGSTLMPFKFFLNNGYVKSEKELINIISSKGITKKDNIVTYCTAGIRSAYVQVVLEMLGYKIKNYDESFYIWAMEKETKLGFVKDGLPYNSITMKQFNDDLKSSENYILIDIQNKNDFVKDHFNDAIGTDAYPVKSKNDKIKLDKALNILKSSEKNIIIISPKSNDSARRAFNHLKSKGIKQNRMFILDGQRSSWFF